MKWNWRDEFSKKNILKLIGYIILLIVLWFAVMSVKNQCNLFCQIQIEDCLIWKNKSSLNVTIGNLTINPLTIS